MILSDYVFDKLTKSTIKFRAFATLAIGYRIFLTSPVSEVAICSGKYSCNEINDFFYNLQHNSKLISIFTNFCQRVSVCTVRVWIFLLTSFGNVPLIRFAIGIFFHNARLSDVRELTFNDSRCVRLTFDEAV